MAFLDGVLETTDAPFDITHPPYGKSCCARSRRLADCFRHFNQLIEICPEGFVYAPDVELFRSCYQSHAKIAECTFQNPKWLRTDALLEAEVFNDFIAYMRKEAARQGVRKAIRDWKYGMTIRQKEKIAKYLRTMPNRTTKLLAVRCELQYREVAQSADDVMVRAIEEGVPALRFEDFGEGELPECRARLDSGVAMRHRDRFLANRYGKDRRLFDSLIGQVWKIEQSEAGVIHHHVLFIFDGQVVKDDLARLEPIFRRWETITDGSGYAHSTHYKKQKWERLGRWHYGYIDTPAALEAMIDDVATYFTKDKQLLRSKPAAKAHTLTKGWPRKPREGGPGRPRGKKWSSIAA
ncbi:conserved hypothetical protein [Cupriavidus necator]|uniref:Inovirus Gp2 family protein n=2 Tax=Cupriavidus necator TaxID=106590 RepID=A0A1K0K0A1_CUPNE|nr:conserved hypothetical protein [Cupriavidus necator]